MVFVFGCLVCAWLGSWVWSGCNVLLGLWLVDCSGFDNLLIRLGGCVVFGVGWPLVGVCALWFFILVTYCSIMYAAYCTL